MYQAYQAHADLLWPWRTAEPLGRRGRGDHGHGQERRAGGAQASSALKHSPDSSALVMNPRAEVLFSRRR